MKINLKSESLPFLTNNAQSFLFFHMHPTQEIENAHTHHLQHIVYHTTNDLKQNKLGWLSPNQLACFHLRK